MFIVQQKYIKYMFSLVKTNEHHVILYLYFYDVIKRQMKIFNLCNK